MWTHGGPSAGPRRQLSQSRSYTSPPRQYRLPVIIKRREGDAHQSSPIESVLGFLALFGSHLSDTHRESGCCCLLLAAAAAAAAQSVTYRMSHGWKPVRRFTLKGIELYNRTARRRPFSVLLCLSPSFTSSFLGGERIYKKTTRCIIFLFFILLVADRDRERVARSIAMCWALIISNERERIYKKEKRKTSNWQVDVRLTETNFVCVFSPRPSYIIRKGIRKRNVR